MQDLYEAERNLTQMRNRMLTPDPDPEPEYICERCLHKIEEGERKWDIYGSILCDSCAQEQFSEIVEDL